MYRCDTAGDLERLEVFHSRAEHILEVEDERLLALAPSVSGWSAAQQIFHVLLANELAYRNVRALLSRDHPRIVREGGPDLAGFLILHFDSMPRGVGRAPRIVTPPPRPNLGIVRDALASNRRELAELAERAGELVRLPGGIRHQDLGVLGAPLWLAFARIHGEHHLALAGEVLAALG